MRHIASLTLSLHLLLFCACAMAWPARCAAQAPGGPGTLLQQQEIPPPPFSATAYRVLYRATGMDGRPNVVSGIVVIPAAGIPPGGRPIVAWTHPTTGVVPR